MSNNPYASSFGGYGQQITSAAPTGSAPTNGGGDLIKETTTANFSADVIRESRNQPVLVDFWAPWCGPCKQLTPIIERAVKAAGGKVKLVKMNIDDHPSIAGQLGVQSIPAVFAFVNGQPVDGFMGALPESEVKAFIDRLTKGAGNGGDPLEEALTQGAELLKAGDVQNAAQLFGAVLQHDPENVKAAAGLAECYLEAGDTDGAKALLDQQPAEKADDPAFAAIRTRLKLEEEIAGLGNPAELQARLDANADDHQARFDLALIAQAKGDREEAANLLLEIVRRDREFAEDGARKKLLEFFEVWGPTDPATKNGRRGLSSLLFR